MKRLSDSISAAWSTVKCPGCRRFVVPVVLPTSDAESGGEAAPRWSFIWTQPRGEVCPECQFPLERYAHRVIWIRLFLTGVVLLGMSAVLLVLSLVGGTNGKLADAPAVVTTLGVVVLLVGLAGIVIGGWHRPKHPSG